MSPIAFRFPPVTLPASARRLRDEVRSFLADELGALPADRRANCWARFDADFSRKLGERGWIGMVFPKRYGGHERSALERYVVIEELLAGGAPLAAHWITDRQSAHNILRHGSERVKSEWLPKLVSGRAFCVAGMSEPNSGSDLASVRTRALRTDGGWRISGQKIWTSQAQHSQLIIALVRTSEPAGERHAGLSQFVFELDRPGIRIRPIADLRGDEHFNEIFFDDVFVPDDALLGHEGDGWKLVTSELALERSGPERYLSSYALFVEYLRLIGPGPSEAAQVVVGRIAAQIWVLRQMSLSVAAALDRGEEPAVEAVVVKDLGNALEQELPRQIQAALDAGEQLHDQGDLPAVLSYLLQTSPSFSLRGGTREILRGVIARSLGLR